MNDRDSMDEAGLSGQSTIRVRLTAAAPFLADLLVALPFLALALLLLGQITQGRQIIYTPDSSGFIHPGLLIASGQDAAGQSIRNLGYPLFTAAVLPLGGFKALIIAQAIVAAAGVAALLLAIRRLVRQPLLFAVIAIIAVITIAAIDAFELDIQTIGGEGLFAAVMPLPLILLVMGWGAKGARRAGYLVAALAAAYLTYLVKPNALLELPVCLAALALGAGMDPRAFLQRKILTALGLFVVGVAVAQFYQAKLLPKDFDFGERHMYCIHLDVVQPELGSATPQRRHLVEVLNDVRRLPNGGYNVVGYDINNCIWRPAPHDAIHAVATSEGLSDKAWLKQQFLRGLTHRPLVYIDEVARETLRYFKSPQGDTNSSEVSEISDQGDWNDLVAHFKLVRVSRAELDAPQVNNWFAIQHPSLAKVGKAIMGWFALSLAWVAVPTTVLALIRLALRWRRRQDVFFELQLLSAGAVMAGAILTVAMSNTWDDGRFAATLAPTALLWWLASGLYLAAIAWPPLVPAPDPVAQPRIGAWMTARLAPASHGMRVAAAVARLVWHRTRTFWDGLLMALPFVALALLLLGQITQGRQVIYNPDSMSFIHPGLLIASGQDAAGQSIRNLGYPLFTAAVLPLGGFKALIIAQAIVAAAGVAALLLAIRRLVRQPLLFAVIAIIAVITIAAIDTFEFNSQIVGAEGLFAAVMPLPLILLVMGWGARSARRAGCLVAALAAAYLTYLIKPNALLELPVCLAALALGACMDPRAFLQRKILTALGLFVVCVAVAQSYQAKLLPKDFDFGERHMYCMHLDVVQPELGSATPQRRHLVAVLNDVRRLPNAGYNVVGYDINACVWRPAPHDAIHAVATSEGLSDKAWLKQQFLAGLAHRPLVYIDEVAQETLRYFKSPQGDASTTEVSAIPSQSEWNELAAHGKLVQVSRAELDAPRVDSWFKVQHPALAAFGKAIIELFAVWLPWVAIPATALALVECVWRWRRRQDVSSALQLLSGGAIMAAAILTVAMSNTWDSGRFASTLAPTAMLWWFASGLYLLAVARRGLALAASFAKTDKLHAPSAPPNPA